MKENIAKNIDFSIDIRESRICFDDLILAEDNPNFEHNYGEVPYPMDVKSIYAEARVDNTHRIPQLVKKPKKDNKGNN